MTLTVFDLDKTLIQGDSNELWHEFLLERGILSEEFKKEDERLMALYAKGDLDMDEYLTFAVSGLNAVEDDKVDALMGEFLDIKIKPIIYKQTPEVLKKSEHKIIISATPEFVVKPVSHFLGVDECIGMQLLKKDGLYTGKYNLPLSYKEGKVECLKKYIDEKNIKPHEIIFYSDSINDLPLLEFADVSYCINPDEKLEKVALKNGWDIFKWSK